MATKAPEKCTQLGFILQASPKFRPVQGRRWAQGHTGPTVKYIQSRACLTLATQGHGGLQESTEPPGEAEMNYCLDSRQILYFRSMSSIWLLRLKGELTKDMK